MASRRVLHIQAGFLVQLFKIQATHARIGIASGPHRHQLLSSTSCRAAAPAACVSFRGMSRRGFSSAAPAISPLQLDKDADDDGEDHHGDDPEKYTPVAAEGLERIQPSPRTFNTTTTTTFTTTTIPSTSPSWTRDDDKLLASLRRKKLSLDQIQIYMAHQPLSVVESKLESLQCRQKAKPTFQRWTAYEDQVLERAVKEFGAQSRWSEISDVYFSGGGTALASLPISAESLASSSSSSSSEENLEQQHHHPVQKRSPRACQIRYKFLHPESGAGGFRVGPWFPEEIELFQELVVTPPPPPSSSTCTDTLVADVTYDWDEISRAIGTRSPIQCHSQYKTVMHSGTKGKWTPQELEKLLKAFDLYGKDWRAVAKYVGTRAPGQVRQKYNQVGSKRGGESE